MIDIKQGETTNIFIPVVDDAGVPVDLTTLTDLCFVLYGPGHSKSVKPGDPEFTYETDVAVNDSALITLSPDDTRIQPTGALHRFEFWGTGPAGRKKLAADTVRIIRTRGCD